MSDVGTYEPREGAPIFDLERLPGDLDVGERVLDEWVRGGRLPAHRVPPPKQGDQDDRDEGIPEPRFWAFRDDVQKLISGEQLDPLPEPDDDLRRVYVIELEGCQLNSHAGDRCLYVGESVRAPRARFIQHLCGYKDATHVRKWGVRLLPERYRHVPASKRTSESQQLELETARRLAAEGFDVHPRHLVEPDGPAAHRRAR